MGRLKRHFDIIVSNPEGVLHPSEIPVNIEFWFDTRPKGGATIKSSEMVTLLFYMTYYIYILYSNSIDRYYVGYSSDPWLRLEQHLNNSKDRYTGKVNDWVFSAVFEVAESESDAIRLERFIKKQKSRNLIEKLCAPDFIPTGYLAQLVRVPHVRD